MWWGKAATPANVNTDSTFPSWRLRHRSSSTFTATNASPTSREAEAAQLDKIAIDLAADCGPQARWHRAAYVSRLPAPPPISIKDLLFKGAFDISRSRCGTAGGAFTPPRTYTTASWRTNSRSRGKEPKPINDLLRHEVVPYVPTDTPVQGFGHDVINPKVHA